MIRLTDVTKGFERPVLHGVNVHVPDGCLYGLVGPGAAGKSLVLKLVASLLGPDGGTVTVNDEDVGAMTDAELSEHRRGIGMVFQNNALFDHLTVGENVAFPLRRLGALADAEIAERVAERLAGVGLAGFDSRSTSGLSGGQKKRVGIARATITNAPIVLYDEPAAGLDPVTSQRIFDVLRAEQQRRGATVIMVSSDIERLVTITDRIGMMHEGSVIFEGTTAEAARTEHPVVRQFLDGNPDGPL